MVFSETTNAKYTTFATNVNIFLAAYNFSVTGDFNELDII